VNENVNNIGPNTTTADSEPARYKKYMREHWEKSEHGKLCLAYYEAFHALRTYCEKYGFPSAAPTDHVTGYDEYQLAEEGLRIGEQLKQKRDEKLRKNLERAQNAARCQHVFLNGDVCSSPRIRGKKLCRMHARLEEAQALKLDLGPMEDPDSIQIGIKKLQAAIIDAKLDAKQIGHLAYTIQLAAWNVMRTTTVKGEKSS
jgi:hypothetical protein